MRVQSKQQNKEYIFNVFHRANLSKFDAIKKESQTLIMKITITILALFTIVFTGCLFHRTNPAQLWFFTYSSDTGVADSSLNPASFLNLEQDKSYTMDFGHFDYGHWTSEKGKIILKSDSGKDSVLQVKQLNGKELSLFSADGTILEFESLPDKGSGTGSDPFSIANNKWRITASHKESDEEIKKRLYGHCQFYEAYFRWALDNDINTIDVRSTPSPIKIYGNGFALKEFNDLPQAWKSYFYDEEDCRKATDILKDIFNHKDIAWPKTDNKYKFFISAFQQLGHYLQ